MPYGHHAAAVGTPSRMYENGVADNNAQAAGAPLCLDVSEISGGTTARGVAITDGMAVAQFVEKPANANGLLFAGVAEKAMDAGGNIQRYIFCGPTSALVHNPDAAASLALAVGDLVQLVPGQAYLEPALMAASAGGAGRFKLSWGCAKAVGCVRKAQTLAAGATAEVQIYLWPPRTSSTLLTLAFPAAPGADIADYLWACAPGPGVIGALSWGVKAATAGEITWDVKINATSVFSVLPKIVNDCIDGFHSGVTTAAGGAGAGPGTAGVYGTIDPTKLYLAKGDLIKYSLDEDGGSGWDGTGMTLQALILWF